MSGRLGVTVVPADVEAYWLPGGGTTVAVKLAGEATGGTFSLLEVRLAPGSGAGPHRHTKESETIVVLAGELVVGVGAREEVLGPGGTILVPRDVMHTFANRTAETTRALFFCVPSGLEAFFRAIGIRVVGREPPREVFAQPDAEALARAAERAGLEFLPAA